MRVAVVSCAHLAQALTALGHQVLSLDPSGGVVAVSDLLAGWHPELLVQVEHLGGRCLLSGLDQLACPTVFWSVDTHLNLFWQRDYARLFDHVLTTQPHLPNALRSGAGWLPWFGPDRPWVPHGQRRHELGFVGRLSDHRPVRTLFMDFLRQHGQVAVESDLNTGAMLEFYADVRLVANETIAGEINFRTFEAAACGCAVLNPAEPAALAELFSPGKACLTYAHGLELADHLQRLRQAPQEAEALGRAAWEAVQARHLVAHRAARLLELAPQPAVPRAVGSAAEQALVLAGRALERAGMLAGGAMAQRLLALAAEAGAPAELVAAAIRLEAEARLKEPLGRRLATLLTHSGHAGQLALNLAASLAGWHVGDAALALVFRRRYEAAHGLPPVALDQLLGAWAADLARAGCVLESGRLFEPESQVAETAVEVLVLALKQAPEELELHRRLEMLLRGAPGAKATRLGLLSHLSLRARNDWRLGLALGLLDIELFRVEEGLEELRLALAQAQEAGRRGIFVRTLTARDSGGSIARRLGLRQEPGAGADQATSGDLAKGLEEA